MFDLLIGLVLTALLLRAAARLPERARVRAIPSREHQEQDMKIAVVGAGISGLASAWLLSSAIKSPCSKPATTSAATPTPSTSSWPVRASRWIPASWCSTIAPTRT
jgi:hypothetical protein